MAAAYSYMLAAGTLTKSALTSNSAYNVENFPAASDQPLPSLPWREPQRQNTTRPKPARLATLTDFSVRADGFWLFQWSWPVFTPGMLKYFEDTFFSSGAAWSAAVTVQTYTDNGTYQAFNAVMKRPEPGVDYDIRDGLYTNIVFKFQGGVLL